MSGLDRQLDGDDEEIIDLEDIIEMPDRPIDEEEDLDLDGDIFDVDEELESPPAVSARKSAGPPPVKGRVQTEQEDLLGAFGAETDEEDMLFEPTVSVSNGKPSGQRAPRPIADEEEDLLLDDLLAESGPADRQEGKQSSLRERAEAALKFTEEELPEQGFEELLAQEEVAPPAPVSEASAAEISAMAEELVARIESRLQEHIRAVVESMLPDLVRSILNEEITKLKHELK
ncbi:MAG: hypothetical protein ACP5SH_16595 [Syntrophobacteraceae bacterium]